MQGGLQGSSRGGRHGGGLTGMHGRTVQVCEDVGIVFVELCSVAAGVGCGGGGSRVPLPACGRGMTEVKGCCAVAAGLWQPAEWLG